MDERELERIVDKFAPSVYRLAYARTGSRADAEDVMQEVFLRLLRKRPQFRDDEHCKAWLLRAAANRANDLFRSAWRKHTAPLEDGLTVAAPEPEAGGVLEAVLALPETYRVPVHLFYYEDLSVAEIAAVLGKSEGAVKTRLSRARDLLRESMKGEENHA